MAFRTDVERFSPIFVSYCALLRAVSRRHFFALSPDLDLAVIVVVEPSGRLFEQLSGRPLALLKSD